MISRDIKLIAAASMKLSRISYILFLILIEEILFNMGIFQKCLAKSLYVYTANWYTSGRSTLSAISD